MCWHKKVGEVCEEFEKKNSSYFGAGWCRCVQRRGDESFQISDVRPSALSYVYILSTVVWFLNKFLMFY